MPRGGFRVGAGRKPFRQAEKTARAARKARETTPAAPPAVLVPDPPGQVWPFQDDVCRAPDPPSPPTGAPAVPGAFDFAAATAAIEARLRPLASAEGTLVPATEFEFRELCQLAVEQSRALAAFRAEGFTEFGLRLERSYRGLTQRLETKLRSFKLAPFGKEIVPPASAKPKSALEALKERAQTLRAVK